MRTLGVDLAASPLKTGACAIDWEIGTVELLERPITDDQLVDAITTADFTGIDVPLGWPDAFVAGLVAHHRGEPWPALDPELANDRVPLRFRATDLVLAEAGGRWPLSVSTDLIGVPALHGARLQRLLHEAGIPVDRSGTAGKIAEVYPAAALRHWALRSSGYKGKPNLDICHALASDLAERCGSLSGAVRTALTDCDDDSFDSVVCAIVARAVQLRKTTGPDEAQLEPARREGWIHVPTAAIEDIIDPG